MSSRTIITCRSCGQTRRLMAHGLCATCYARDWRSKNKAREAIPDGWEADADCQPSRQPAWNPRRSDGWPGMTIDQKLAVCETCPVRVSCSITGIHDPYADDVYGGEVINNRKDTAA